MKIIHSKGRYFNYGRLDGKVAIITGGNSGSPMLDGKGRLIGLAFDGNWEAMSGDVAFEPALQRCIAVDVRYVLFVIDKFAGCKHIMSELDIATK